MSKRVYLDNAATTPLAPEVAEAMGRYSEQEYGNASSLHALGRQARKTIEESRGEIANSLGVMPKEIVFTSGATEANNLAIKGLAFAHPEKRHLITCKTEHHAVLHTCQWLEERGSEITYLDVDRSGRVSPDQLVEAIRDDTLLVSIMVGNNEIGTVQPIEQIGTICRERGVLFHTDAVQAYGKVPLPMDTIDLLSVSAHKLHGPKGVGFLAVRKGVSLTPLLHGGGHEGGRRSTTENTQGIVGLAAAARLAFRDMQSTTKRMRAYRQQLIASLTKIPGTRLNGHETEGLPHIVNVSFQAIEGESLVMKLDELGFAVSTGSACSSPNLEPSHVLVAIAVPLSMAHGSLRISTGRQTTQEEIDAFLEALPRAVEELRAISPFKVGA